MYLMLALSGDTSMSSMFCIPSVHVIERRNVAEAVAVRAITFTVRGKILLTSPNRENSQRNDSPLKYRMSGTFLFNHTHNIILTTF